MLLFIPGLLHEAGSVIEKEEESPKSGKVVIVKIPTMMKDIEIFNFIVEKAIEHEVDISVAINVVECESGFDETQIGDNGQSFGIWQIYLPSHPNVTKTQAQDPYWATEWSMLRLKKTPEIWTCYRDLYLTYPA